MISLSSLKLTWGFSQFESIFGLKTNPAKSSFYCTGVSKDDKAAFLDILHMPEGSLPVKYLGVPLITKKLSALDCEALVAKVAGKIDSCWLSISLLLRGCN